MHSLERRPGPSDEDLQLAGIGLWDAAEHRRVDHVDGVQQRGSDLTDRVGSDRRHLDQQRPVAEPLGGAVGPEHDVADGLLVREHGDRDLRSVDRLSRSRRHRRPSLAERLRPFLAAVPHGDVMPRVEQPAGHGRSHPSGPQECDPHLARPPPFMARGSLARRWRRRPGALDAGARSTRERISVRSAARKRGRPSGPGSARPPTSRNGRAGGRSGCRSRAPFSTTPP